MKKLLLLLFITILFVGCNKEDDKFKQIIFTYTSKRTYPTQYVNVKLYYENNGQRTDLEKGNSTAILNGQSTKYYMCPMGVTLHYEFSSFSDTITIKGNNESIIFLNSITKTPADSLYSGTYTVN